MKEILIIVVVLFVGACSKVLTQHHINEAIDYCEDKEGLYKLKVMDNKEKYVTCKDGSIFKLSGINPN